MISIVVAMDKNRLIGRDNRIPWKLRSDLVQLKTLTMDHTVILGRKTYESMVGYYDRSGREMPAKSYIVVTRDPTYAPARSSGKVAHSITEAIKLAKEIGDEQVFAIGGNSIYETILPYTDTIFLTEVQAELEGDTFFPSLDSEEWHETERHHYQKDDRNEYDFDMVILERIHPPVR